jgi:hypothetical protein
MMRSADLVDVSTNSVLWAIRQLDDRVAIEAGRKPLIPSRAAMQAMRPSRPVRTDREILTAMVNKRGHDAVSELLFDICFGGLALGSEADLLSIMSAD